MGATTEHATFQTITNPTGRVFRVGETPRDILGHGRWVPIMAAWLAMCLAGLLEYTWGTVAGSLQAAHHWSLAQTFWAFSFFVVFESFVQIFTGILRNKAGDLFVSDYGNKAIREILRNDSVSTVVITDKPSSQNGPYDMTFDASGNIYVADETAVLKITLK